MDVKKVKVEFNNRFGNFKVVSTVEPSEQSIWVSDFNVSVYEFATCKIKIKSKTSLDPYLNKLERRHQVIFSASEDDNQFIPIFVGEISRLEIRWLEDKTEEIEIDAQTPFVRLQEPFLNQESLKGCVGFRQIIKRVMELGHVWGTVLFDEDVRDDVEVGYIHNFSAFSLLKQICLQRDLVFEIDEKQNSMRIANRITSEREKFANIKTISADDILSMKIER